MDTILSIYLGGGSTLSIISKISQNLSSFETKVESEYKKIFFLVGSTILMYYCFLSIHFVAGDDCVPEE